MMHRRTLWRIKVVASAILLILVLATNPVARAENAAPLKVGFIMVGPVNDFGWNYAHNQGREYLEKTLKGKVETNYVEKIPENSDVERVLEKMISQGTKLIFATSYGYLEPAMRVASKHPDIIIMHCGNRSRPQKINNVGTYFGSQYGAAYVVGTVAGRMTKKNNIGCVESQPVPQIIEKLNSFTLGVHSVNPSAKVHIVWINNWTDPPTEAEATESLIDQGSDLVASGDVDSPITVVHTSERRKIKTVSWNGGDMQSQAPNSWTVSTYWNWGPLYVKIAQSVLDKTWKADDARYSLKDGYLKLSSFGKSVPDTVQKQTVELFNKVADGKIAIFKGPISDRDGKLRIPAGKVPDKSDLEKMNWVVPGVEGSIPKN
jgi:basic membrane protein A and related proteins